MAFDDVDHFSSSFFFFLSFDFHATLGLLMNTSFFFADHQTIGAAGSQRSMGVLIARSGSDTADGVKLCIWICVPH